ncbi:hypothetical protein TBLA_0F02520 [Henningerozyma blattae CBS 6284]|uniref:MTHFR SAM-binding regulatory domain-containing protein n=1 Tax=Henningerozyma blattae (strain ATCC 34711 / CBS 6284 / DSM 70876 / NBRC 10599 / NRRL Y-10934 / UCD 77-7) TaxID=1071380 RepID=I2H5Z0_HENB6|nr:hypothetical protein TBLA_0F02520 [Tetrapisispora blattae CBS 6284]CCH61792.1 hypothetical protein TBLA_0F02520 [Tetrapisispora blattae CBS 6284]
MKITEKLQKNHNNLNGSSHPTFSFEYFVPKTDQGVQNLYDRIDKMYQNSLPQFIDITWNASGSITNISTNELVSNTQSVLGLETCMHLTCTNMDVSLIDNALKYAYESGCQNILALRGDPPSTECTKKEGSNANIDDDTEVKQCFKYAKDLVKYIRVRYGDYFDIGVAGYPEGHPENMAKKKKQSNHRTGNINNNSSDAEMLDEEMVEDDSGEDPEEELLLHLKEKVDAGANFIITQMFYDADNFIDWCHKVYDIGIHIPIFPGIMPITTYSAFLRRSDWCQIKIPQEFLDVLEPIKENDQLVRKVGVDLIAGLCQRILKAGVVNHLHLYTMNLESPSIMLLSKLNLLPTEEDTYIDNKAIANDVVSNGNELNIYPWRKSLNPKRKNEQVRPIFWKSRLYSYIARTSNWQNDEFPNGRFGDSSSPAFGDLDLCGSKLIRQSNKKSIELWSKPVSIDDIGKLVNNYLTGKLSCLPWSDIPVNKEIEGILGHLTELNNKNIITINSQPKVNGIKSNNKIFGWGPTDGYIYQKQYLEFLLPRNKIAKLSEELNCKQRNPHCILTYFSVDNFGKLATNQPDIQSSTNVTTKSNCVTWGVFPGREILQPTIVEKYSFLAWKEEFYKILEEWKLKLYQAEALESVSLLQHLIDDYVLINIVDNDFVDPEDKIFKLLISL